MPPLFAVHDLHASRVIERVPARLSGVNARFESGRFHILHGSPGSGHGLLLRVLALLETHDAGELRLAGEAVGAWDESRRSQYRSAHFGFVFPAPFLLPSFNVIENIAMPLFKLTGALPEEAREKTGRVLEWVGMQSHAEADVLQLPLWAQLRVSLARALVTNPAALFVDHVERDLAPQERRDFVALLAGIQRFHPCCVIMATADPDLTRFGTDAFEMAEGRIIRQQSQPLSGGSAS